jgi:phosphate transport system permease protein
MTTHTGSPEGAETDRGHTPPVRFAHLGGGSTGPVRWVRSRDLPYRVLIGAFAAFVAFVVAYYLFIIIDQSVPGWKLVGWKFFTSTNWNFGAGDYGAIPIIVGTLLTTALALLLAVPVGIGSALAIVYVIPRKLRLIVSSIVELLAVVPSIVYGLWGLFVLRPWLDNKGDPWLQHLFHGQWPFSGLAQGDGLLLGMIVLGIMILPTIAAISRDVLLAVPNELMEGGLSVGASRSQVIRKVILPTARIGLLGAISLGAARALGETIALVLVLGNVSGVSPVPTNLFSTLGTIATEIVNNYGNFSGGLGVLSCLAMVLMVIVGTVNLSARLIVRRQYQRLQA